MNMNSTKSPITAIRVTFSFDELDALIDCLHHVREKNYYTTKAYIKLVGLQRKAEIKAEPRVREVLDLDTPVSLRVAKGQTVCYPGLNEAETLEYDSLFAKSGRGIDLNESENSRLSELFEKQCISVG